MRTAANAGIAAVVVTLLAGISGWMAGYPSLVWAGARFGLSFVPLQLPAISSLEEQGVKPAYDGQPVIAWGIAPYSGLLGIDLTAGYPDWLTREATSWLGFDGLPGDAIPAVLLNRDAPALCEYLWQNPDALRVTGPNPKAGIPWLVDSGCPTEVIKPDLWVEVEIQDEWFQDISVFQQPYEFPTWQQLQDYRAGIAPRQS